jgi:GT2 family glycosyltransferase
MTQKVTISIALYNKLEFTKQCLKYLYKNTNQELFDLVIIDNSSTDGTIEWLTKEFPNEIKINDKTHNYTILLNNVNVGFARAHNQAFKECKTEYFLPLNNDTIPLNNWLEPLIEELDKNKKTAIVGCKLISPIIQGLQHVGVVFRNDNQPIHRLFGYQPEYEGANIKQYAPAVTGASFIIRSEVFKQVNGFDELYRNSYEDIDLCLAVRELGYQIIYHPESVLYHYEGQTVGRLDDDINNRDLFLKRWSSRISMWGNRDYNQWKKEYDKLSKKERMKIDEVHNNPYLRKK